MNHQLISKALSGIDGKYIAQSLTHPVTGAEAPESKQTMANHARHISSRRILGLAFAACLIFALAATAYAANAFGIRELFHARGKALPDQAAPYIQAHTESADMDGLSARITQSLCDGGKLLVTVEIRGADSYLLCGEDSSGEDSVASIGIVGSETLAEYAVNHGKELLFVGAHLDGDNLSGVQSSNYTYTGNGSLILLMEADLTGEITEGICRIAAQGGVDASVEDVRRLEIPFSLSPAPSAQERVFMPKDPNAVAGMVLGSATVWESPMGMTVRWQETITDVDQFYNLMKVEIVGCSYAEGGSVQDDDGNWYFNASMVEGDITDNFTVQFYDWDDTCIGETVFTR